MLRRFEEADQSPLLRAVLCDGSDTNFHEAGGQGREPIRRSGVARYGEVIIPQGRWKKVWKKGMGGKKEKKDGWKRKKRKGKGR